MLNIVSITNLQSVRSLHSR